MLLIPMLSTAGAILPGLGQAQERNLSASGETHTMKD